MRGTIGAMKTPNMLRVSLREMLLIVALAGSFSALYRERQISRPIREAVELYHANKANLVIGSNYGPMAAFAIHDGIGISVQAMDRSTLEFYTGDRFKDAPAKP